MSFVKPQIEERPIQMEEIHVKVHEVLKILKKVMRKAMGPDDVAEQILRVSRAISKMHR